MTVAHYGDMHDTSWETWRDKDLRQLSSCDAIIILPLDGWKISKGVRGEIKFAINNKKPIFMLDPDLMVVVPITNEDILHDVGVNSIDELND
jgi:hypothetical protein